MCAVLREMEVVVQMDARGCCTEEIALRTAKEKEGAILGDVAPTLHSIQLLKASHFAHGTCSGPREAREEH